MPSKQLAPSVWTRLFAAADRITEIAPWEWMFEDEMFGVQDPVSGEINYVSVMGHLGEHYSIAVYLGDEAANDILSLMGDPYAADPERILETRQLQLSYEDRNQLEQNDRDLIKSMGLKYRGRNAWPMFRSYRAGYIPWRLDEEEAELLATVLEQAIQVIERYADDDDLLFADEEEGETEGEHYLVRVPAVTATGLTWQDEFKLLKPTPAQVLDIGISKEALRRAEKLPRKKGTLEVDFFMVPTPIGTRGERAQLPYMLLVVDAKSGMVFGADMVEVTGTVLDTMVQLPEMLTITLLRLGYVPSEIHTKSTRLAQILSGWANLIKTPVQNRPRLPSLEMAKEGMLSFLDR